MSLAKYYTMLALVQAGLLAYWLSQGSLGAVFIASVGLIALGATYLVAKRRLQVLNDYHRDVLAALKFHDTTDGQQG